MAGKQRFSALFFSLIFVFLGGLGCGSEPEDQNQNQNWQIGDDGDSDSDSDGPGEGDSDGPGEGDSDGPGDSDNDGEGNGVDHCEDGVLSGNETDVDCGGSCQGCDLGESCILDQDCLSESCFQGTCQEPRKALGELCERDRECQSDRCESISGQRYCAGSCDDCLDPAYTCFEDNCLPTTFCENPSGFGAGPGCDGEPCDLCDALATCSLDGSDISCVCPEGYEGDGFECADIDECALGIDSCDEFASCSNTAGGYECQCDAGFEGDGFTCTDIDECALGTDSCDEFASCTNTTGGYECACNSGFEGDGLTCADIDECALGTDSCHENATCSNTLGGYDCACDAGFTGDGETCVDVDECALGIDTCDSNATCFNLTGSYSCGCNPGFTGNGYSCSDIDECTLGIDSCHQNASCNNTQGSYDCECNEGYSGNGIQCTDINECVLGIDTCSSNGICFNLQGSYTCACAPGYSGDGYQCEDIDECALGTDSCHQYAECFNISGSYLCECQSGFTGNGYNCTDINECALGTDNCHARAECINIPGSYDCVCDDGLLGDGTFCEIPGNRCEVAFSVDAIPFSFSSDIIEAENNYAINNGWCPGINFDFGGSAPDMAFEFTPSESATYYFELETGYDGGLYITTDCADLQNSCLFGLDQVFFAGTERGSVFLEADTTYFIIVGPYSAQSPANPSTELRIQLDECLIDGIPFCPTSAECEMSADGPTCTCAEGFEFDGTNCVDIDECTLGIDECSPNATCVNSPGSYDCLCEAPFLGDGRFVCEDQFVEGDSCYAPIEIIGDDLPFSVATTTVGRSNFHSFGNNTCLGVSSSRNGGNSEEVHSFIPSVSGVYEIIVDDQFDSVLYVTSSCGPITADTCLGASDAAGASGQERLELFLEAGETYFIFVGGWSNTQSSTGEGTYTLIINAL